MTQVNILIYILYAMPNRPIGQRNWCNSSSVFLFDFLKCLQFFSRRDSGAVPLIGLQRSSHCRI